VFPTGNIGLQPLAIIKQYRDKLRTKGRLDIDLTELLVNFREWNATNERDKIYALLSLATNDLAVEPDYEQILKQIFCKTMISILEKDERIDWICGDHFDKSPLMQPFWVLHIGYFNSRKNRTLISSSLVPF
jgi:hypothetical protein